MTSFLNRLKSNAGGSNGAAGGQPTKKSQSSTPLSPLEVLVAASGVTKGDGSDKFFGMHNPSNTCYFNSVVQCLYYSEPFREQMVTFPVRTPRDRISISSPAPPKQTIAATAVTADAETAQRINEHFGLAPVRRPANQTPTSPTVGPRPEDNKDSFEYKKKQAINNGPFYVLEGSNFGDYGMPESLFTGLKDLFEAMIAHDARIGIISPAKFLEVLRSNFELFRSPQHQDAHEFLNLLLNEVVEQVEAYSKKTRHSVESAGGIVSASAITRSIPEAVHKTNTSWVHDIFEGTLTSETRCLTCENVSQRDEVFLDLSVDLEENSSVTACLRKFSEEEMLCEKNKFHCDKCGGLQEAEKRMKIKRLPRILALHLKRFKYVEELGRLLKLFHRVVFPFYLRLLNTTDDAEEPDRLYELYAVIVHLGSTPFHGHYVSIIKTKSGGWLLFDDEFVLPVDKEYIKNYFGGDARNPACAYVLFYQQTTEEAAFQDQDPEDLPPDEILTTTPNDAAALGLKVDDAASPMLSPLSNMKTPAADPEDAFTSLNSGVPIGYAPRASEEDTLPTTNGHHRSSLEMADPPEMTDARTPGGTEKASRGFSALKNGSLKLRAPSMSLRQRPKLWGKFEKVDNSEPLDTPVAADDNGVPKESERTPRHLPERQESKLKLNRFSLARKKSSYVHQ